MENVALLLIGFAIGVIAHDWATHTQIFETPELKSLHGWMVGLALLIIGLVLWSNI